MIAVAAAAQAQQGMTDNQVIAKLASAAPQAIVNDATIAAMDRAARCGRFARVPTASPASSFPARPCAPTTPLFLSRLEEAAPRTKLGTEPLSCTAGEGGTRDRGL
jgi:hypothetical protein